MRTIYEVTVNGSPVYNGENAEKARATRDEWKKSGRVVEFLTVSAPDVIDAQPARLTANELAVLTAIDASEYGDQITDAIWAWSVADHCKLTGKTISGTVSSLQKKGLTKSGDSGRDATICMTDEGVRVYAAAVGAARRKWIDDADLKAMQAARAAVQS